MRLFYGIPGRYKDITDTFIKTNRDSYYIIPKSDVLRSEIFGDPNPGVQKELVMHLNGNIMTIPSGIACVFEQSQDGYKIVDYHDDGDEGAHLAYRKYYPEEYLAEIHNRTFLSVGTIADEYPEQIMTTKFLDKDAVVLEIGGNVGHSSLTISALLNKSSNLVVLECDPSSADLLTNHRDLNNFSFKVEAAALSEHKIIQQGWNTKPHEGEDIPHGWTLVNTITYDELMNKYMMRFNTLVLDCEGAFYHILKSYPQILYGIQTIFVENDYSDASHLNYVDSVLISEGFDCIYSMPHSYCTFPGASRFYETWRRN